MGLDKDIAVLREIKCLPRMYEAYGPKLTRTLDALEEAREVIVEYGGPNKMSETRDTLLNRFERFRKDARAFLAKYGEGEK